MRLAVFALILGLVAAGSMVGAQEATTVSRSKMGCDTETEVWNAAVGKCEPGTPKYKRKSETKVPDKMAAVAKKDPAKKAPAKKAAAAKKTPAAK